MAWGLRPLLRLAHLAVADEEAPDNGGDRQPNRDDSDEL